ncbi:MAG: DNA-binding protein [Planctomycetaceae bacterium]|nr:DNA-binding protein [Planctomycetaceae bacterium]
MNALQSHRCGLPFVMRACLVLAIVLARVPTRGDEIDDLFANPPPAARPWVIWYWMHGCISHEGIAADLDAMQQAGIGGAYLMPIKPPLAPSPWPQPVETLSPEWDAAVKFAVAEAHRRDLQIAMHLCDGFATAGGPWITPELSMQQVTCHALNWPDGAIGSGVTIDKPPHREGFYRDIAVVALPAPPGAGVTSQSHPAPRVTTSTGEAADFLLDSSRRGRVRTTEPGWIQYEFAKPFTCRSVTITPDGNNYQAQRLAIEASNDGRAFRPVAQLAAPRHGWHNGEGVVTHAIPPTTARVFRFGWDKEGSEPGAEDLDSAKWSPVLKVTAIELSAEPRIHQYRGKTAAVWRASPRTTAELVPDELCVPQESILDLTDRLRGEYLVDWTPPPGAWTILRIGHTSTGATNATGGAGQGLECDKLNAAAVRLQFDKWFARARDTVGPELAEQTLRTLHLDSWECGSQNWTADLLEQFAARRGYDARPYLPVLAGVPVDSADASERFLFDYRQTLAELLQERFFDTLTRLARDRGCQFTAECTAPVMMGHGMRHFAAVDVPMGEFWLRSPTHDKPNDMLDAISAAHVYGKPIVQAEAFTQLRIGWDEHPGMLKPLADREFARGANRLAHHLFVQQPWLDRAPGMTLSSIGVLFQRGQTWWPAVRAWNDYLSRCQALLQWGRPVVDIAVFAGEDVPSRAVPPHYLVDKLPGLFPGRKIEHERQRRENRGAPTREQPPGVRHSANIVDPDDWVDPLGGYKYDSIDRHALLELATVKDGRIELPGGASYRLLVVPGVTPMQPSGGRMSVELVRKLLELVEAGATIALCERPTQTLGLGDNAAGDAQLAQIVDKLWPAEIVDGGEKRKTTVAQVGRGWVVRGPLTEQAETTVGLRADCVLNFLNAETVPPPTIAWSHRRGDDGDAYYVANLTDAAAQPMVGMHCEEGDVAVLQPVDGRIRRAGRIGEFSGDAAPLDRVWRNGERTWATLSLAPHQSAFIVVRRKGDGGPVDAPPVAGASDSAEYQELLGPWRVAFQPITGEKFVAELPKLADLSQHDDPRVRHFAGTAVYETTLHRGEDSAGAAGESARVWLELGQVENLAQVSLNGQSCGVAWTPPFRVELTPHLRVGENQLQIAVTNTWRNRLVGEQRDAVPKASWTTAALPAADAELLPAGLLGPVELVEEP